MALIGVARLFSGKKTIFEYVRGSIVIAAILMAGVSTEPAEARSLSQRLEDLPTAEYVYLGLHTADFAITAVCLDKVKHCSESNPIYGRHPSAGKLVGLWLGSSIAQATVISLIQDHNPKAAELGAKMSVAIGVGIVAWNLKVCF
jgi:hypothetical protein